MGTICDVTTPCLASHRIYTVFFNARLPLSDVNLGTSVSHSSGGFPVSILKWPHDARICTWASKHPNPITVQYKDKLFSSSQAGDLTRSINQVKRKAQSLHETHVIPIPQIYYALTKISNGF